MTTDERYDIDLGAYVRGLLHWWWIIVALAILGAVVGAGLTLAHHSTYQATSSVYLGQPTDANGNPISAINTDPRAAIEIGNAESTLARVARQVGGGETVRRLHANVSVTTPALTTKTATAPINIVTVSVSDTKRVRAAAAANAIAAIIVDRLATYDTGKIALLTAEVAGDDKHLAQLTTRSDAAQANLNAIAAGGGAPATKAMASAPYLGIVQSANAEMQSLLDDRRTAALTLLVARGVEAPAILTQAVPPSTPQPRPLKVNVAIGLLVGLIVGLVAAAVLEWRRREGAAA
ncbi:MAG: Wzz/FepE/Etk N-terminal domain-containing protein [Thermoleophilia bacterium]